MPWPKTVTTHFHAQLELTDNGRAIKRMVVYDGWDLDTRKKIKMY